MKTRLAAARHSKLPEPTHSVRRTISVAALRISRFSPLRVELPEWVIQGILRVHLSDMCDIRPIPN